MKFIVIVIRKKISEKILYTNEFNYSNSIKILDKDICYRCSLLLLLSNLKNEDMKKKFINLIPEIQKKYNFNIDNNDIFNIDFLNKK